MHRSKNNETECLSESVLSGIASNQLSEAELEAYESHLSTCQACREQLEMLSAGTHAWRAARSFLRDDEFDELRFSCRETSDELSDDFAKLLKFLGPTDDPHILGRLGNYEVAGIIGAGGMGIVLKALERALGRFVALKVLTPRLWKDRQARERFAREARAAASIVHENVIEIYAVGEVDGIPFFSMPYLRGDNLQARIDRQGPLKVEELLRVAMQVAAGLAAAHAQGLVHRDIKPANILLGAGAERVRITDFGIAHLGDDPRLTQSGLVAGTPQYMSPEQVRGEEVDGRSDLFSLGSVIYAMAAGRPPFVADSHYQLLHKVVNADSPPVEQVNPSVPKWLAAIVAKLHAPAPADRYQSAKELAADLEQCLASWQQPTTALRPRTVTQLEAKYRRRRRLNVRPLFLGGLLMFGIAIVVLAVLINGFWSPAASAAADSIRVQGRVVDEDGGAVPDTTILAVQKTWPNNRYQQEMLKTTTDKEGRFSFENFAEPGKQYAFLVAVVSDQWLMTSEYRLVKDGKQQDPLTLKTEKSEPVTFRFTAKGKPVSQLRALPTRRALADGTEYLSYPQHIWESGVESNDRGEVRLGSWKAGEKGAIAYLVGDDVDTFEFTVPANRVISVALKAVPPKPVSGPPVYVAGKVVDQSGKAAPDIKVLAIQKTWPNNRYQQRALSATTDQDGKFRFNDFAPAGSQYAFLLTVVADGYAMTSEYQVVEDGSQKDPVTLKLEPAEPVTLLLTDADGKPLEGVTISPESRVVNASTEFLNYSMHMKNSSKRSDAKGEVSFCAWKAGEAGSVHYEYQQKYGELRFKVDQNRRAVLTMPRE